MFLACPWGWGGLEIPLVPSKDGIGETSLYLPICESGALQCRKDVRGGTVKVSGLSLLPTPSFPCQLPRIRNMTIGKFVLGRSEDLRTRMFRGCNTQGRKGGGTNVVREKISQRPAPLNLPVPPLLDLQLPSSSSSPAPLLPSHWRRWQAGPPWDLKGPLAALPWEPQLVPALRPAGEAAGRRRRRWRRQQCVPGPRDRSFLPAR